MRRRVWGLAAALLLASFFFTPEPHPVVLVLLGDVMLGRGMAGAGEQALEALQPALSTADLALANLESPLTNAPPETSSPYVLCAPPGQVTALRAAGIDLVSLANNHRADCGAQGLAETRRVLAAAGIQALGPELEPVYRVVRGRKLAFLALEDVTQDAPLEQAARAVEQARRAGALVVVSVHWGLEYQSAPDARQQTQAQRLADAGAALVWGHHPHVTQPAAWVWGTGQPTPTLVLYSLGNALFDSYGLAVTRRGEMVLVRVGLAGSTGFAIQPFTINVGGKRVNP